MEPARWRFYFRSAVRQSRLTAARHSVQDGGGAAAGSAGLVEAAAAGGVGTARPGGG